jgi:hypothetical protein
MNHIKRVELVLILLILTIKPFPTFAIVHGDVELLKTVALKNKENFESLLTWKGEAFEERTSIQGDWYDYMMKNKCIFAYDHLQNAVRWNKKPQEYRFMNHGKSLVPELAFNNSAMFKGRFYYEYSGRQQPDDRKIVAYFHLAINNPIVARGWGGHCLDPRYFFADPGGATIHDKLMLIYNNANNPKQFEWYVKRAEDLVTLEVQFGEDNNKTEKCVYDLSAGGNMVEYYNKSPTAENTRKCEYEEKSGVWILKSYKKTNATHRKNGEISRSTRTINWSNSVVNVPFEEDEFTAEKLGLKHGDHVSDHINEIAYIYDGTLIEMPASPKALIKEQLPQLKDLGINLSPADVNDKSFLVCFFDLGQRPSRNCILQLSKRAQELKAKDIVIVAIQASKIEQEKLDEWIKENEITFPVGMIEGDEDKTRLVWGIKSLPWLILTDKQHIVTAEGFSINELNEKIKRSINE